MEVKFSLAYHELVIREDIPKIAPEWRIKIKAAIEVKLLIAPEQFGKPLGKSLKGYRKLRVGDYRIIFKIAGNKIKIFVIQHRKVVYRGPTKRL